MTHVLIHYREIGLKGKNRSWFEGLLEQNIRAQLPKEARAVVMRIDGRLLATMEAPFSEVQEQLALICGISSFAEVVVMAPEKEIIMQTACALLRARPLGTFVVRTKRGDKKFPHTSEVMNRDVGAAILEHVGGTVQLKGADTTVSIEIVRKQAMIATEWHAGPGGFPVGASGRVAALLSGGIDSPVAAWKVMKRGCETVFVHFHSYPHTSRASINKVEKLARIVGAYQPKSVLYLVPLGEAQRQVVMHTAPKYRVLLYRRLMMRIAAAIAVREGTEALITGESIGQVASQTLSNMRAVEAISLLPVFRPLIGDDKEEIITKAKAIGTYETSIEPHDDCCTLFVPKNPATRSTAAILDREEQQLPVSQLVEETLKQVEVKRW